MPILVRFWILLSTALVAGGWILSALHELNRPGYAVVLPLLAVLVFVWCRKAKPDFRQDFQRWRCKISKRFRRRAPQMYLLILLLAFLGGCLYPPVNYDANAYRLPRVLHWLAAGQWHWIHTFDSRMNVAACGMEWLSAPLILFSRTDRLLFLINWISYLLLPGLIFSVFTRLEVRPRAAWWWTWFLSAGLCFALQAGSAANDSIAAVYMLAAVDLALRAGEKKSIADLCLSLLAAALATGVKQPNVPLFALWCIAAWPARSLFLRNPLRSVLAGGFGLLVSIVPISVLNYRHYGAWLPLGNNGIGIVGHFTVNPFLAIIGNAFCIPVQNLVPPFYTLLPPFHSYWAVLWNQWMREFLRTPLGAPFASFENFGFLSAASYHGLCEANAGLGLGICLMVLVTIFQLRRLRKESRITGHAAKTLRVPSLLRLAPWGLLLIFMAKNDAFENARQLAPYYPFLFPAWLVRAGQSQVTRQPSWRRLGLWTMAVTVLLIVASTERPLFPAQTVFKLVQSRFPNSDFLSDECVHYLDSTYQAGLARRNYLKEKLPRGEKVIGYFDKLSSADEPALWLPYGQRRVECLLPDDPPQRLRDLGIHFAVLNASSIRSTCGTIEKWTTRYNASVVDQYEFAKSTRLPADLPDLYIVRLN